MIALITDFGKDYYVGVLKAVLSSQTKNQIIDIAHNILPGNIRQAAWILLQSFNYFPKHTIFLGVVDPGVGSDRKPLIIETRNYFFVGPDNGMLYPAAKRDGIIRMFEIKTPSAASKTFHGRDVFAKVAAKIDSGKKSNTLGKKVESIQQITFRSKKSGEVAHIDRFGNIITTIKPKDKAEYTIQTKKEKKVIPFYSTYDEATENELFCIEGSSGTLEISIKNKRAVSQLMVSVGTKIQIE